MPKVSNASSMRWFLNSLPDPCGIIRDDEDGINIDHLLECKANVTYVTPSHQFPNGMVMPIARRLALLKWAKESGSYNIEDDYDGEFQYKGKPIPSLQGLDYENEKVIYLGTFSKSLIPSIRMSYMVLPTDLLERYKEHFTIYKQTFLVCINTHLIILYRTNLRVIYLNHNI